MKATFKGEAMPYLTEGKEYEVLEIATETGDHGRLFYIESDEGKLAACLEKDCSHLHGGDWNLE